MNRKSVAVVKECLDRVRAMCVVSEYHPPELRRRAVRVHLTGISDLCGCALKEIEFNGGGVFPAGAVQGEFDVDIKRKDALE